MQNTNLIQEQNLTQLVSALNLNGVRYTLHAVRGDPADQLTRQVMAHQSELIVMGSVQHTGVGGLLIGSTATTLLRQVECAVLAVKPEDFASPALPDGEDRETRCPHRIRAHSNTSDAAMPRA